MPESDNLGHKFLSFFIKDAEPGAPGPVPAAPAGAGFSAVAPVAPLPPGTIDGKFAEHLTGVLAKSNLPGPDYFEFREALRGLAGLDLSEGKQYQAAWATFKALGGPADVSALTGTAQQYLTLLAQDRNAFGQSVDQAVQERVGGLQREQQQVQADNEALAKQLVDIQQKSTANAARLATISGEIAEQSAKLTQNRQNYEATYGHFTQQIKNDVNKITQYLK